MKLYNITFNLNDKRQILEPSIPDSAGKSEDKTIRRICITDSVEHCMQAIAVGNRDIREGAHIIVRTIDTKELNTELLITPKELFKRQLVPDALENQEYWYLGTIKFKCYMCKIMEFDAEVDLAWSCIKIQDCKNIIKEYIPEFPVGRYKISKNLFDSVMLYCNEYKMYDISDEIWDDLAMLPWAQKRRINRVRLVKIH